MKCVVVAAGGGNDIFSAVAYADTITFDEILLVGVLGLTPFHYPKSLSTFSICIHGNGKYIEPPLIVPTETISRYIVMNPPRQINCSEKILPKITKHKCVCLSSKYSALEQSNNLSKYLCENDYSPSNTIIHLVDFGGDILTDGSHCISPELDAFSLSVVRLMSQYKARMFVLFPGVDGELSKEYLKDKCKNASCSSPNKMTTGSLYKVYDAIKELRPGNTIPNMIKVLNGQHDISISKCWVKDGKKITYSSSIDIAWELQNYVWEFDLHKMQNPFCFAFLDKEYDLKKLLKCVNEIYSVRKTGLQLSDLYLQYLRLDDEGRWSNKLLSDNIPILIDYFPDLCQN
jgi:hypothetical protein